MDDIQYNSIKKDLKDSKEDVILQKSGNEMGMVCDVHNCFCGGSCKCSSRRTG